MKLFTFDYKDTSLLVGIELEHVTKELIPEIKRIQRALTTGYTTDYASINLPADTQAFNHVYEIVRAKKELKPSLLVLIGIGGSNLGTIAVHEAMHGPLYNQKNPPIKFLCADTLDSDVLTDQLKLVEQELKNGNTVLVNVVTKSGSTTETIANFELFLALLKKHKPENFHEYVIVTTDIQSKFSIYAQEHQFTVLEIPAKVGGRYSVLSAVGLFPLGILGIDIKALIQGAQQIISFCTSENIQENPAALSALLKYAHYQQCVNINDMFLFATPLAQIGAWYRQLMGESIGKEFNRNNQKIEVGITPTVSMGSTDLHSVGQLYLGGPRDKFTTFISVEKRNTDLEVPNMPEFESFVAKIQKKKLSSIMDAILQGVQAAYKDNNRPFCSLRLPVIDAQTLGALLQMYMIEMMYLGFLFDVNPFDQPNVESYKKETRKILANE